MSIRGSLRTMCIEDLFDWIDRSRLVGHLSAERGEVAHSFYFDKGAVTASSSNVPGEHLSQLLMSRGLIDEHALSEALGIQADTGVFLAKVLLMSGTVKSQPLREVLEMKIRESIWDVLSWEGGYFQFDEGPRGGAEFAIRVPLRTTLDLGKSQVARWRAVRRLVPRDSLRFFVTDFFAVQDLSRSERIQAQTTRLVECVERGLTLNQIILEHHGRRFQVSSRLAELIERGALAVDRRSEARASEHHEAAIDMEVAARNHAAGGKRVEALELTTRALREDPESQSLQELHKELQRSLVAELSRELLGTFRVPKLMMDKDAAEALELSDSERYLVGRIDGRWDLLSLLRISPLREVDALLTFKRLQERGIIEL